MDDQKKTSALLVGGMALFLLVLVVALLLAARGQGNAESASPSQGPDTAILNIVWQWTQLTDQASGSAVTTVPSPEDYTLIFNPDGTFNGMADCNSISGTYSTQNGFFVNVQTSTRAFCGEGSLDTLYLQTLSQVVAGGPDGAGGLALETAGGAQRMQFKNGGSAR